MKPGAKSRLFTFQSYNTEGAKCSPPLRREGTVYIPIITGFMIFWPLLVYQTSFARAVSIWFLWHLPVGEGTDWGPDTVLTVHKSSLHWIQKFCVCFQNNINNVDMKTYQTFKSMILKCNYMSNFKDKKDLSEFLAKLFYSL